MSASIQDLSEFRKRKEKNKPETASEIFQRMVNETMIEWETAFYEGGLDKFVNQRVGLKQKDIFNLNDIALIEKALGMEVAVFHPNTLRHDIQGFVAGFNHARFAFATPETGSEAEARIINILLFQKVKALEKTGTF